jgi:hypothetical protein
LGGDGQSNKQMILLHGVPNSSLPSQPSTARLQKIESRPEKSAASRSAETPMSDIMYLPMRNGLANGFPSTSVIDPTAGMRFQVLRDPRPKKPIWKPLRAPTDHCALKRLGFSKGQTRRRWPCQRPLPFIKGAVIPEFSPKTGNKGCFRPI